MNHSKLPFVARGSNIEDADGLLVADTNQSCGLTRGMDLANAELLAKSANMHDELMAIVRDVANIHEYVSGAEDIKYATACRAYKLIDVARALLKKYKVT